MTDRPLVSTKVPSFPVQDQIDSIAAQAAGLWRRARAKRAGLFYGRWLLRPRLTQRWLDYLESLRLRYDLGLPHDELLQKPVAKFLCHGMDEHQRLALICGHFDLAVAVMDRAILRRVWAGHEVELGQLDGRAAAYVLTLVLADCCGGRHEGCLALRLRRQSDGLDLCNMKFVLTATPQGITAIIGGVQGAQDAKRAVIDATRDLGGLRPKDAVLLAIQGLVAPCGAPGCLAVARDRLPIAYRRRRRQQMLKADNDSFWLDRRGVAEPVYGFHVPWTGLTGDKLRDRCKRRCAALGAAARADALPEGGGDQTR